MLVFFMLLFPVSLVSQTYPCFVEITTDTVTAYSISSGSWEQKGFTLSQTDKRDSIGVRAVEVLKLFYINERGEKVYLGYEHRKFLWGVKDEDRRVFPR